MLQWALIFLVVALIAGALGLALVLIASYLAGAAVSAPLRRMARVAARVDDGAVELVVDGDEPPALRGVLGGVRRERLG